MGNYQEGPAVALLEVHELHHENAGIYAFVGRVAKVREVVDDGYFAAKPKHGFLDVCQDFLFVVLYVQGHGVDLGPVEARGEGVECAGEIVGVAHLELFVGELAVYQKDVLELGDVFCNLDSVDGFAEVGV